MIINNEQIEVILKLNKIERGELITAIINKSKKQNVGELYPRIAASLKEFERLKKKGGGEKRETFTLPTVEEIAEYCRERGNNVDPQRFFDFYQSKGWLVGKVKMKDWKACVRTWEKRMSEEERGKNKKYEDGSMYAKL